MQKQPTVQDVLFCDVFFILIFHVLYIYAADKDEMKKITKFDFLNVFFFSRILNSALFVKDTQHYYPGHTSEEDAGHCWGKHQSLSVSRAVS